MCLDANEPYEARVTECVELENEPASAGFSIRATLWLLFSVLSFVSMV